MACALLKTVVADLDSNVARRQAALGYFVALTHIAHETMAARCAEIGEDLESYLQRISLPAAETHGNEIEAYALEDYVDALIAERLATEPQLLTHAAEVLRSPDSRSRNCGGRFRGSAL
jgi:hypothetical protein